MDFDFEKIMQEITSGLTGSKEHDLPYLQEQCEKYKEHSMAREIIRACGRLLYQYMSDESREEFNRTMKNFDIGHEAVMEEVRFKVYQKKYDEALPLIESLVQKFEETGFFEDDQVSEYHHFNEPFEEILYNFINKPAKDLRQATFPLDEIYLMYGSLLVDLKRFADAQKALAIAVRWNPTNAKIAFEHAETSKMLGDMDTFYKLTKNIFRIAFRPDDLARCYRNLGFYFVEKELWREAMGCYLLSLQYDRESKNAMSELYYIHDKTGNKVKEPTIAEMKALAERHGFPMGADKDILGLSYAYGKHFAEQKDFETARYFWQITYGLTDDEEIKSMMDALPEE